ncbi:hypothetical protein J2S18_001135 [Eubacterium multiforme]|uniref:Uncharacterized protein n=1 Tax=Eubacterium multiforme TaxID=83339 RepID=A0ABT9USC4_9FIRM|nr:hypothetical protein [Eubacterium multiforme]
MVIEYRKRSILELINIGKNSSELIKKIEEKRKKLIYIKINNQCLVLKQDHKNSKVYL